MHRMSIGSPCTCRAISPLPRTWLLKHLQRLGLRATGIRVGSVKAYLLMIARNLYRDEKRRRGAVPLPANLEVADTAAGPEASAQARHELQRVLDALREIPDADRELLSMAAIEGLTHQAIATALEISVDAVKVRVHRARVRLNAVLAAMEAHHVHHTPSHS
jgi:RNA polymerase sigma factor (sigma-70 family)